jgi:hypothetical protein
MASSLPATADSRNKFEDLSGVDTSAYLNPYDALIDACENDPVETPFYFSSIQRSAPQPNYQLYRYPYE